MIWLLKDFDLLAVMLRALTLGLEAVTLGGLAFLLLVAGPLAKAEERAGAELGMGRLRRGVSIAAVGLGVTQVAATGLTVVMLTAGSGLRFTELLSASFLVSGAVLAASAGMIALLVRGRARSMQRWCVLPGATLLAASVAMSHAASRLEDRLLLSVFTAAHHLGTAAWLGAMVFLLLALRQPSLVDDAALAQSVARRYSRLAMAGVALLVGGGLGLAWFYVGSWPGLYGTSYGVLVMAKSYLLLAMLLLGASNQRLVSAGDLGLLYRLRRFSEAEIGLGFTAVLAAASLTSQAPAIDLASPQDRVTGHEIVERLRWRAPRLTSPAVAALAPSVSLEAALPQQQFGSGRQNDANDRAWSEYNHHWAGLIVLAAGLLALAGRGLRHRPDAVHRWLHAVAQAWPLLFVGLALLIVLRADPENWPLGPRPFWASFSRPDVLEHRLYAGLITCFAFFEWGVERRSLASRRAAYVFPLAFAAGGAVLLTHAHALGSVHEEMLAEFSHTPLALLGATAGWARWLEVRLPGGREARVASLVWPLCLVLVSVVLLDYRES
ncbi:MAG TPA: CopD family protein [Acidobacteriaceae bacterium]